MTFGEKIRSFRDKFNFSQKELAEKLGVSFQTISKWENDYSYPDIKEIPRIAMIFHVSIDDLFGYDYQDEDQKVESICEEVWKIRKTNPKAGEKILRDALQIYPGNPILLNSELKF